MKPESARFVAQANIMPAGPTSCWGVGLNEDAAREAYLASFRVAQAYIFERTNKVLKTHQGVQTQFFRVIKDDNRSDRGLWQFLAQFYEFKAIADYFSSPDPTTSPEVATKALVTAKRFVEHIAGLVPVPDR